MVLNAELQLPEMCYRAAAVLQKYKYRTAYVDIYVSTQWIYVNIYMYIHSVYTVHIEVSSDIERNRNAHQNVGVAIVGRLWAFRYKLVTHVL